MNLRMLSALALAVVVTSCSQPAQKAAAPPAVACEDAPALAGWSVASSGFGVTLTRADGASAAVLRKPIAALTNEHRQKAQEQVAAGNWRATNARVPGYASYEMSFRGVRIEPLVSETDDSYGSCGDDGCRIFVTLSERGAAIEVNTSIAAAPSLPELMREIEPQIAHVIAHCSV